jgi:disulfide bond formation protein DsbB
MKKNPKKHLSPRFYLTFLVFTCLVALGIAYGAEHYFNLKPCVLCLYQRSIFWVLIGIGVLGICMPRRRHQIFLLFASGVLFTVNAAIAAYQVLIEKHLIDLPQICQAPKVSPATAGFKAFKHALTKTTLVPCDQVGWEFLGVSLAGYTSLFGLIAAFFCILMAVRARQSVK